METIINIILISIICVIVTDNTDFFQTLEKQIGKWLNTQNIHIKPLECSLCQTFWLSFIYLIISNNVNLKTIALALFISILTPIINAIIQFIRDTLITLINWVDKINN